MTQQYTIPRRRSGRLLMLVPILLLLGGCGTQGPPHFQLNESTGITLPEAGWITQSMEREQLLEVEYHGKVEHLHVILTMESENVRLVVLSPMGILLSEAVYAEGRVSSTQRFPGMQIPPPQQVLGDILMCYLPVDAWREALPSGWVLADDPDGARRLRDHAGELVSEIHFAEGSPDSIRDPISIRHFTFGYQIEIETLERRSSSE